MSTLSIAVHLAKIKATFILTSQNVCFAPKIMKILQLTLAIIKPHIIKNPFHLDQIRTAILSNGFKIVQCRRKTISSSESQAFYEDHKGKFFYNRLMTFMTSGPSDILILAKADAISDWRVLMGPTKVFRAQFESPDSLRGLYGLSDTRNAAHGSDSDGSARREIGVFFPGFDVDDWYRYEEPIFRSDEVRFDEQRFLHVPNRVVVNE